MVTLERSLLSLRCPWLYSSSHSAASTASADFIVLFFCASWSSSEPCAFGDLDAAVGGGGGGVGGGGGPGGGGGGGIAQATAPRLKGQAAQQARRQLRLRQLRLRQGPEEINKHDS